MVETMWPADNWEAFSGSVRYLFDQTGVIRSGKGFWKGSLSHISMLLLFFRFFIHLKCIYRQQYPPLLVNSSISFGKCIPLCNHHLINTEKDLLLPNTSLLFFYSHCPLPTATPYPSLTCFLNKYLGVGWLPRSCDRCMLKFFRNCPTFLQGGCLILHSHQQNRRW